MIQFQFLFANESREIRNHENKTSGKSMEHFRNISHDDFQKLMNKSKSKSATMADWGSMGRAVTQARGRAFQTLGRNLNFFLRFGQVFEKLGCVF